ncbi:MAG: TetR/AcrR family transcriptional regulator [Halanaerobiaceae bacterium]
MDRKVIQEKRKKGYFIEAAKKIIEEEGVANLTVKKVADLAGFAVGTLYNYFSDLNDLYSHCARDYWEDCKDYVIYKGKGTENIKSKIIKCSQAYCEYFIDNPNVFQLIFLQDFDELPDETPEVVLLLIDSLKQAVQEGIIPQNRCEMVENLISSSIHGILLFIIKKRSKATRNEALALIQEEVKYILDQC